MVKKTKEDLRWKRRGCGGSCGGFGGFAVVKSVKERKMKVMVVGGAVVFAFVE